jgi:16S rRNA (guanine966-N2)-methyltransferase
MRVIGGHWRGRSLVAPRGRDTRPTSDRLRKSLFDILEHGLPARAEHPPLPRDARVLDLFAGSGALGLEALSRGARRAVFIESAAPARAAVRRNTETLGCMERVQIWQRDATRLGAMPNSAGGPFDLVFLDPPYRQGLAAPALASARASGWLAEGAVAVVECAADEALPVAEGFGLVLERRYGDTRLAFYRSA